MKLPNIDDDQFPIKTDINEIIYGKYQENSKFNKLVFRWKLAEFDWVAQLPQQQSLLLAVLNLQKVCAKQQIPPFYSYFVMKLSSKFSNLNQQLIQLESQAKAIIENNSTFHYIEKLIGMREDILTNIIDGLDCRSMEAVFMEIDQLRLVNFQLIGALKSWKQNILNEFPDQTPIFLWRGQNYLIKIINDNAGILSKINMKHQIFFSPPNPFFLTQDGNRNGIGQRQQTQIDSSWQVLTNQKAMQLRMILNPSDYFGVQKTDSGPSGIILHVNERKHLTKNVSNLPYKPRKLKSRSTPSLRKSSEPLEQFIKEEEHKASKIIHRKSFGAKQRPQKITNIQLSNYKERINSLRRQVQQNIRKEPKKPISKNKQLTSSVLFSEIKSIKPKILFVTDKQSRADICQPEKKEKQTKHNRYHSFYKNAQQRNNFTESQVPITHFQATERANAKGQEGKKTKQEKCKKKNRRQQRRKHSMSEEPMEAFRVTKQEKNLKKDSSFQSDEGQYMKEKKQKFRDVCQKKKNPAFSKHQNFAKDCHHSMGKQFQQEAQFRDEKKRKINEKKMQLMAVSQSKEKQIKLKSKQVEEYNKQKALKDRRIRELQHILSQQKHQKLENCSQPRIKLLRQSLEQKKKKRLDSYQRKKKQVELQDKIMQENVQLESQKIARLKEQQLDLREKEIKLQFQLDLEIMREEFARKEKEFQETLLAGQKKNRENDLRLLQKQARSDQDRRELELKQLKQQILAQLVEEQNSKNQAQYEEELQFGKLQNEMYKKELKQIEQNQKLLVNKHQKSKSDIQRVIKSMQKQAQFIEIQNQRKLAEIEAVKKEREQQNEKLRVLEKEIEQLNNQRQRRLFNKNAKRGAEEQEQLLRQDDSFKHKEKRNQKDSKKSLKSNFKETKLDEKAQSDNNNKSIEEHRYLNKQLPAINLANSLNFEKRQQTAVGKMRKNCIEEDPERGLKSSHHYRRQLISQNGNQKHILYSLKAEGQSQQKESNLITERDERQHIVGRSSQSQRIPYNQRVYQNAAIRTKTQERKNKEAIWQNQIEDMRELTTKRQSKGQGQQKGMKKQAVRQGIRVQTLKQNGDQILSKYSELMKLVDKTMKQIYISENTVGNFIDKYYNNLPQNIRQMQVHNKTALRQIFANKKVDIYHGDSGYAFGWLEKQKYEFYGCIEALQCVARKYGSLQVETIYLFNSANTYQKGFVAKRIKLYDRIGYVYQKMLEQGHFSFRFILRIPKEIAGNPKAQNVLIISQTLCFQSHNEASELTSSFQYALSQVTSTALTKAEYMQLINSPGSFLYKDTSPINNSYVNTVHLSDNIVQISIQLQLQYIMTAKTACFVMRAEEYCNIYDKEVRIYKAKISQQVMIAVHQWYNLGELKLDEYLDAKSKNIQFIRQVLLCIPTFNSQESAHANSFRPFSLKTSFKSNLSYPSIINYSLQNDDYIFIDSDFVFCIYQLIAAKESGRCICSKIIEKKQTVNFHHQVLNVIDF